MTYDFHELALLFPLMEGAAFDDLTADIKTNGLREPIVLLNGKILDGRNRALACEAAEIEPVFRAFGNRLSDGDDPLRFIVSGNLHRRHLDTSQRAMIAGRIANMRQGERTDLEPSGNSGKVSQAQAAQLLNISTDSVADAKTVLEYGSPDLQAAVDAGKVKVSRAAAEAKPKRKSSPAVKQKKEDAVRLRDQGRTHPEVAKELGISQRDVRRAIDDENLRREGEVRAAVAKINREDLSLTAQQKFDAAIAQHKKKLDNEFEDRVREETVQRINETSLPHWRKKLETIQRDIELARRKGVFTKAQFKRISAHLHPDHIKDPKADNDVFDLFRKQELALVNKTESPTPSPSATELPQSYADLMEAKRKTSELRKQKRKKGNMITEDFIA